MTNTQTQPKYRGMDMLHGSIADKLFFFAMPIGLMGLFEQLFNSADVFILGHFVGKNAMAAVGNNMPVIGLLVTLLIGISLGANVTIAQYLGAGKQDKVEETVQTAIGMALGLGVLLTAVGELIAHPALMILDVPADVYDLASTYLRIFLLGMPFLTLYNFEAAIFRSWRGWEDTALQPGGRQCTEHLSGPLVRGSLRLGTYRGGQCHGAVFCGECGDPVRPFVQDAPAHPAPAA